MLFTALLLADFKENQKTILFSGFKNPYKKSTKQENSSLFMNSILYNGKRLEFMPRSRNIY
jgi:hypothetical protein